MTRELLEQATTILHRHHKLQTRYGNARRAANATCADFKTSPIAELAESAYMHGIGKETEVLLEAIRAHLDQPQGEPAWHDAPTVPGLWFNTLSMIVVDLEHVDGFLTGRTRWYGPIPQETAP